MRILFFLLACPLFAAIDNLQIIGATSTQIAISYTAPTTASCTIEVSKESDYTPLVKDVDTTYYTSANSDDRTGNITAGRYRVFVIGKQGPSAIETALTGYTMSRALQADTEHYIRVTCGGDTATVTARTTNIPLGDTRGEPLAVDQSTIWNYKRVTTNRAVLEEFADPYTGTLIKQPAALGGFAYTQSTATTSEGYSPLDCNVTLTGVKGSCKFTDAVGTDWSPTSGTLTDAIRTDDDNYATYSGTAQDKMFVRLGGARKYPLNSTYGQTLSFQNLAFSAKTSDASGEGGWLRTCLTTDGSTCASPAQRVTLTATEAVYSVCSDSPCTVKDNPGDTMLDKQHVLVMGSAKVYNVAGSLDVIRFAGSNATAACNLLYVDEVFAAYDSRTNGVNPYYLTIASKSCGSSPPQVTLTSAAYDLTHNGTTGVTFWTFGGIHQNFRYGILVWKESTTSGATVSVDIALWRAAVGPAWVMAFGSGGFGKRCQIVPTAGGYYLCMTGSDANQIIGVKPTSDGLDIVNYGLAGWRGDTLSGSLANAGYPSGSSASVNDAMWDDENPGVFYMYFVSNYSSPSAGGNVIVKMTLTLATPSAADPDGSHPPGGTGAPAAGVTAVILTPCVSPCASAADDDFVLSAQRTRAIASYVDYRKTKFASCSIETVQADTLIEICKAGEQDTQGYIFAYDLGNRLPVGGGFVGTRGGNTQQLFAGFFIPELDSCRWCVVHTMQNPLKAGGAPFVTIENSDKEYMYVTAGNSLSSCSLTAGGIGDCGDCPNVTLDGVNYDSKSWCNTLNVSTSWDGGWGSTPTGYVAGDPTSTGGAGAPNLHWFQAAAVGDFFLNGSEIVRIIEKVSNTQWTVIRGWGGVADSFYAPVAHSNGVSWRTYCGAIGRNPSTVDPEESWGLSWYFGDDYAGTNPTYTFWSQWQNHGFQASNYGANPPAQLVYPFDFSSPAANAASLTQGYYVERANKFAGVSSSCVGNSCETHAGAPQVAGTAAVQRWYHDVHPRLIIVGGTNAVALASGKTYIYQYNGTANVNPRHYGLEVFSGQYPFKRVDTLSDAASDTGKFCTTIIANDCFSGSTAGKLYFVNEVFDTTFIALNTCRESQFGNVNGDFCGGNSNGQSASVTQWNVPSAPALNFSRARAVAKEFRFYREAATENVKADPTGTALMARAQYYFVPPPMANVDTRNRATFAAIPSTLTSVPGGTDNALIQFGYNTEFQCNSNRDNTCYAEAAALNEATPYRFDHETLTGVSCGSGCTITIPALANRVLYWRWVFRNVGGTVIARGATNIQAVN